MERKQTIISIFRNHILLSIMMILILCVPCTVKANGAQSFVVWQYEQNGEQYVELAICVDLENDEISLLTLLTGEEMNYDSAAVIQENVSYPIEFMGSIGDILAVWNCQEPDILQYVDKIKLDYPVKGEQVTADFFSEKNGNIEFCTQQTYLSENKALKEGDASSGYIISFDEINSNGDYVYLPGVLENASGKCVGIIMNNGIAYPLAYDDNVFQSTVEQEKQTQYQTGEKTEKQTGTQKTPQNDAQTENIIEDVSSAIVGLILLILSVVLGNIWYKKIKKGKTPTKPEPLIQPEPSIPSKPSIQPELPIPPKPPIPPEPPILPKPQGSPKKQLYLYIKNGYMMGQVYPIGEDKILIGRDSRCRIKYPKDYAGISNIHASVFRMKGKIYLKDENSSYGTFLKNSVGAKKIEATQPQELREGSEFYLAETKNMIQVVNVATK